MPSFVRGIFAGARHDALLFPFPPPLEVRSPDEARTVRRLIDALRQMRHEGLIDSAAFDDQEASRPGAIVLLHEGQSWTMEALPMILGKFGKAGHDLVTMGELLHG